MTAVLTSYLRTGPPIPALMINTHSSGRVWEGLVPFPALGSGVLMAEAQRGSSRVVVLFPNRALWFGSATLPLYRQGSTRRNPGLSSQARSDERLPGGAPGFVSGCPTTSEDDYLCHTVPRCKVAPACIWERLGWSGGAIGASASSLSGVPQLRGREHTPGPCPCQDFPLPAMRIYFCSQPAPANVIPSTGISTLCISHYRHTHPLRLEHYV
jgi:hypothetical protein